MGEIAAAGSAGLDAVARMCSPLYRAQPVRGAIVGFLDVGEWRAHSAAPLASDRRARSSDATRHSGLPGDDGATLIDHIIGLQLRRGRRPAEVAHAALQQLDGMFAFVALLPDINTKLIDLLLGFGTSESFAYTGERAACSKSKPIALEPDAIAILTPLSISIVDRGGMWIEKRPSQTDGPAPLMSAGAD